MQTLLSPALECRAQFPARVGQWLASGKGRFALLAAAACFSLPAMFANLPSLGVDPSWKVSLQLAAMQGKVFGRDFVFTYGPMGWLVLHCPVNKLVLLLFDLFMLGGLLSIYQRLLPKAPTFLDALLLISLAIVTKTALGLGVGSSAVLFTVQCYWLWRVDVRGDAMA